MGTKLLGVLVLICALSATCLSDDPTEYQRECLRKDYGEERIVCVCNSKYCDTVPSVEKTRSSEYIKYTSNKAGLRFKKNNGLLKTFKSSSSAENVIYVDATTEYQEITGWGGAFSDSTGINIANMSEEVQKQILRSYFAKDGIEYNLCRVPIGATDFSTHPYTYLEEEDPTLLNFSLAEEDFNYKIPFIKQAMNLSQNDLKLFGSPWTAPKWMKTFPLYAGGGSIKEELYPVWAKYFVKFLEQYREHGIEFWGLTTGNEPSLAKILVQMTPTVNWDPESMRTFIRDHLGPAIKSSNYSATKIIALDDQRGYLPDLETILNDSVASSYIDGIGVHWYQDWYVSAQLLNDTHEKFPDKFLLATEACEGSFFMDHIFKNNVILGSWDRAESFAYDIIEDMNHWVTGWVSWNMVLNLEGGPSYISNFVDAPIIVNATADEFYKQPMFYAHGHFSKFIPEGSRRIYISQLENYNQSVTLSGFRRPDNGTVVVVLNRLHTMIPVTIVDKERQISEYVSPSSITTFVYWN